MAIKQLGGVFGRNPTFSMVDIEGDGTAFNSLDVTGNVEIDDGRLRVLRTANTSYVQMEIDSTSAFIQSTYSDGGTSDLRFLHNSSEIMRITGNGITFNGDTAAANALDDYEEGSYAPADNNIGAYANGFGRYVKVGNMVNYSGQLTFRPTPIQTQQIYIYRLALGILLVPKQLAVYSVQRQVTFF